MKLRAIGAAAVLGLGACGAEQAPFETPDAGTRVRVPNVAPIARAGEDRRALIGDRVLLDGRASSDADGPLPALTWRLVEAPKAGLTFEASGAEATFVPTWNGRYVIEVQASDRVATSTDALAIDVDCRPTVAIDGWQDDRADWPEINPPSECLDYRVRAETVIPLGRTLTIGAGATVAIDPGARIAADHGGFVAVGSEEAPIWIGGDGAGPALTFHEAPLAQLIHTTVEGGVEASGASTVLIEHSALIGSSGYGLVIGLFVELENFYANLVTGNARGAVEIELNQAAKLTADSTFTGNGVDVVRLRGSALNTPSTWSALGVPMVLGEASAPTVALLRDLRIEAGAVIELEPDVGIEVALPDVVFEAWGEADRPVRFTGRGRAPQAARGAASPSPTAAGRS